MSIANCSIKLTDEMKNHLNNWINANQSAIAVAVVAASVILMYILRRRCSQTKVQRISVWLLVLYAWMVLYKTIGSRNGNNYGLNLTLFWSYELAFSGDSGVLNQILLNILLFLPVGCFAAMIFQGWRKWIISTLTGLLLSGTIEFLQYRWKLGLCEIDDILSNLIGTIMGTVIMYTIERALSKRGDKTK